MAARVPARRSRSLWEPLWRSSSSERCFLTRYPQGSLREGGQIATISGGIDLLAVLTALGAAYGLSQVPGFVTWPLTSFGTAVAYLLVSGLDVLIARAVADHTSFGRAQ